MRVGLFTDGLAHLGRREALQWCAERGILDLEMGVGTWSPRPHLDLAAPARRAGRARPPAGRAARARTAPGLRQRGGQCAASRARGARRGAGGDPRRGRACGAPRRRNGRDDERLPGRTRRRRHDRRVRRVVAVLRRRAALGVAVPRARRALLARALRLGRNGRARGADLPRAAPGADDLRRRELRAPARRGGAEHRHQPRSEPLLVAGRGSAGDHRAARRRDRLRARQGHAALPRADPRCTGCSTPATRSTRTRPPGISPPSAAGARSASGGCCLQALRASGYDGVVSIEHEDPTLTPEASIEASAAALREALSWR